MPLSVKSEVEQPLVGAYFDLARSLLPGSTGVCLLDAALVPCGSRGRIDDAALQAWIRTLGWPAAATAAVECRQADGARVVAVPARDESGHIVGVFAVTLTTAVVSGPTADIEQRIRPIVECAARELAMRSPARKRTETLAGRTAELEWLFELTANMNSRGDDRVLEQLLGAATQRLGCGLGALVIPEKRLVLEFAPDPATAEPLRRTLAQTQAHLLQLAQRGRKPIVVNQSRMPGQLAPSCKLLSVPITRQNGRVLGVLAFFNPGGAPDFSDRNRFLAGHLGRQVAAVLDAQFDLMTGLYTRAALAQAYASIAQRGVDEDRSIVYVDIDRMHLVNEMQGFEIGDELIVRVADLLCPPLLPDGAVAARVTGDRFAVLLPHSDVQQAAQIGRSLCAAAARIRIGPPESLAQVSVSIGIAAVVDMPQALPRALATAEIACKAAKDHGRSRVEIYAFEDASMMRRHGDVMSVCQLRDALKEDRMELYAQRIVPLRDPELPHSFELLVRLRDVDGELMSPAGFIGAAQRYQLLPSIDRWVFERAMQMLAPYRSVLRHSRMTMSINVSGQAIGDDVFIERFAELLRRSELPRGSIMLEITEQSALASLDRTVEVIQSLRKLGCRFALDDFGTGSNSLAYLKSLPVSRVKIDGSFVRDLLTNPKSEATVRGVIQLVKGMDIDTVAEYVENDEIARRLAALGVDYAQGYAYSQPEPLDAVLRKLQDGEDAGTVPVLRQPVASSPARS